MPLLSWKENMSVNNREIDSQHKKLISLTNELSDAMKERKGNDVLGKIINDLITYTKTHFTTEEKLFKNSAFPESAKHISEHEEFINNIQKFKTDFESGKIAMSIEVMNFLSDWLQRHIMGSDQKYVEYLK